MHARRIYKGQQRNPYNTSPLFRPGTTMQRRILSPESNLKTTFQNCQVILSRMNHSKPRRFRSNQEILRKSIRFLYSKTSIQKNTSKGSFLILERREFLLLAKDSWPLYRTICHSPLMKQQPANTTSALEKAHQSVLWAQFKCQHLLAPSIFMSSQRIHHFYFAFMIWIS